jgi:hypothetical protein
MGREDGEKCDEGERRGGDMERVKFSGKIKKGCVIIPDGNIT